MAKKIVSVAEFADRHGVSPVTVRCWIQNGLPAAKEGNRYVIDVASAEEWLSWLDEEENPSDDDDLDEDGGEDEEDDGDVEDDAEEE